MMVEEMKETMQDSFPPPTEPIRFPSFSSVEQTGSVGGVGEELLLGEVPFFAAEGSVAYERGGRVTRAFLDCLPDEWKRDHLVVDSMLVWLQSGQSLATRWFHHEVFPGKNERAYGRANEELGVEHIACALGAPSAREFLTGDLAGLETSELPFDLYRTASDHYPARHDFLRKRRDAGLLDSTIVSTGTVYAYGCGAFQRVIATETPGYHFWIRASRGSSRPVVNGVRNVASPSFTGPWKVSIDV